jgi:predicted nucleic acid-binding protein
MTLVFADACYWIALLNRNDQLHNRAIEASESLQSARLVTTEEVLTEVLNFCSHRPELRSLAGTVVRGILDDRRVQVIEQQHATFASGLALYLARLDKGYSLTDCVSFNTMQQLGIDDALTGDRHFLQAGFSCLLRRD